MSKKTHGKTMRSFGLLSMALILLTLSGWRVEKESETGNGGAAFERSLRVDPGLFANPPKECRQHAWLTLDLSRATEQNMAEQVRRWAEQDLTGGFYLGIGGGSTKGLSDEYLQGSGRRRADSGIGFLSEEYFDLYAKTIEAGLKNGNPPMVFYDEWGYPSGMAGGALYSRYPEHAAKSLEKVERDVTGPTRVELQIPEGIVKGAAMMNLATRELVDVSRQIQGGRRLVCKVPAGRWKAMAFYLNPKASLGQGNKSGYVDYLDPEAVRAYISLSYQPHYEHLKKYFGTVLKITHYDEPAMHVAGGRMWTPGFDASFQKEYGYNPTKYYPALWYDSRPEHGGDPKRALGPPRQAFFRELHQAAGRLVPRTRHPLQRAFRPGRDLQPGARERRSDAGVQASGGSGDRRHLVVGQDQSRVQADQLRRL